MKEPHRCYHEKCRICEKEVHVLDHQCFIQCVDPKEDERKKKSKKQFEYHRKINPDTSVYVDPPVFVYAYFEAMLAPGKTHLPILVCAATSVSDTIHSFYGPECTEEFLAFLTELTVNEYGEERPVICVFHNLKGYDSVFLQHQLLNEARRIEDIVSVGTKYLSFQVKPISFKDSFCLLPMALSFFTSTFGLNELKKGFFPYLFNAQDHQDYVGLILDISYYDPEGMSPKKKQEFETWYATQVDVEFNLKKN